MANSSSTSYIGPEGLCLPEIRVKYCNLHTPQRLCICYTPVDLMRQDMPFCSRLLKLVTLEHLILTISLAFPMPQSFQLDPDSIFAEDLELFAGFQRNSVFIVRKGCDMKRESFQFQFGILLPEKQEKTANLISRDLRQIAPKMFIANDNFMRQKGLIVESVVQSHYLRPLLGYPEWIYAEELAKPGLGLCHQKDPVDCYFWEMAFLFLMSLYSGAELTRAMLWRVLWWRHGRGHGGELWPRRGRGIGQMRKNYGQNEWREGREAVDIELAQIRRPTEQEGEERLEIVVEVEVQGREEPEEDEEEDDWQEAD